MKTRRQQGHSGCAPLLLIVLLVLGFSWVGDTFDRLFTFNSGVSDIDFEQFKQRYYAADSTDLMRRQEFETIDGKTVTWRVRVFAVDEDGVLTWCAEQDKIYDERGNKRWVDHCSAIGKVQLVDESSSPRVNEVIRLSFVPYDAADGDEMSLKGFDGVVMGY